jgi:GNAT superfamily N-acetyltransferase
MDVSFRPATAADVDALVAMRAAFLAEFQNADPADPVLLAALTKYFTTVASTSEFAAYLAEADRRVVAAGAMLLQHHPPSLHNMVGRQAYIFNMYTLPAWRNRGLASTILRKLIDHAKAAGCPKASLHTAPLARPMYARAGFVADDSMMRLDFDPLRP